MRSTDDFIILEYPRQILAAICEDRNICLWEDIYIELGLPWIFKTYNLTADETQKFYYKLLRMSKATSESLEELLKRNLMRTNRKDIKFYNKEGRMRKFSWNAFYCAPFSDSDKTSEIDGLEVWIPKQYMTHEQIDALL